MFRKKPPQRELEACDVPVEEPVPDADLDGLVLFADVDPDDELAVAARRKEYEELFGGGA